MIPTGESIVFLSKDGSVFTKMKSPFSKALLEQSHPEDIIYEHLIHNMLFPGTSTGSSEFQKISKESESSCSKRTYMFRVPTPKMIDDYLRNELGLTKEGKYFYGNEYLAITDISNLSDNVLCDEMESYFSLIPSSD